jgi:hypothetical protein
VIIDLAKRLGGAVMKDYTIIQGQTVPGFMFTFLLAVIALAALPFSCESNGAGKHTLAIYGAVHVYRADTPPADYPGSDFIDVIGPKDHVNVIQVIYKRNYMAVRIRLSDGREGWVFSGESIELYEPQILPGEQNGLARR